jgi:hypothetical protein
MDASEASPDLTAVHGIATVAHHGVHRSKRGGVLRWPSLDVIFGYRGGARPGTYLQGLQPVGSSGAGRVTVRLKLRPSAKVAGSTKG